MRTDLEKKIDRAIKLIRLTVQDNVVEVSYSGGKDSDVILELTKMSGVKYRALYKNTTIDPPGTIAHCKKMGAEIIQPKMRFFDIIENHGFPTRRARFCCGILKEYKMLDIAIQGIRRSESSARSKRYDVNDPVICRIYGSKKVHVNVILPILDWTDNDVEDFIQERGIEVHPLYYDDAGAFHVSRRLGCIGCPMSSKSAKEDFKRYPGMLRQWLKSGQKYLDNHKHTGSYRKFNNSYEMLTHNLFFDTYEDFYTTVHGNLFGEHIDCKAFLEKYFNTKL